MRKECRIRMVSVVLLIALLLTAIPGCGQQEAQVEGEEERLRIVCTIFPEYDWVKQILGERAEEAELTLLMKNGADLHSYQPTVWDMRKIAEADLFLYVGGESDFWVEDALSNLPDPDRKVLNLMEILEDRIYEETHMEGMQVRAEEEHDHEETEYDEHVWLSLRNAKAVCEAVAEALSELDEYNADEYRKNEAAYRRELQELDRQYQETIESSPDPVLVFGDRFPFRYLAEDYGIRYYAAFAGCSAETEASFSTITFLAGKAGELEVPVILSIDGSDQKISRTIAGNTKSGDQTVQVLDSMQSVSETDIEQGETYLAIMERNLEVLRTCFQTQGIFLEDAEL